MNRIIKFRAFDGKTVRYDVTGFEHGKENEMAGVFLDGTYYKIVEVIDVDDSEAPFTAIVDQFTGVKDCSETDIYSGDIVFLDHKMLVGEIVNDGISWRIKLDDDLEWLSDYENDLRVIGNIYEHPNLLTNEE